MNKKTRALTDEQYVNIIRTIQEGFVCKGGKVVKANKRVQISSELTFCTERIQEIIYKNTNAFEQRHQLEHAKGRVCEQQIRVALGTGMRAGELQGLTWDDIDFDKREIRVNKTLVYIRDRASGKYYFKFQTPKTKSGTRTIPMQDNVYNALKRQKVQIKEMQMLASNWNQVSGFENLVFLNVNGRPRQGIDFRNDLLRIENSINKERKKFPEQKGTSYEPIAHIYPHCLRHTFATRCFEGGIDAKTVQNYLGHSSFAITMDLYTHVTEDKAHFEMQKLNQLYQKIG